MTDALERLVLPPRYPRPEGVHPPLDSPEYRSTALRHPKQPLIDVPQTLGELTGPLLGPGRLGELDHDLTRQHPEEPQGQRIIVYGKVLQSGGRPVPDTLVEIWQANAGGRYRHDGDQHPSPLDPNFTGVGRCITDREGNYKFITIQPGAYPWGNHPNAWRPAHIHFSLFGPSVRSRLVTQMYFADDPLHALDPILSSVPTEAARARLIAAYDHDVTEPEWALAWRWDIVLRGAEATPFEAPRDGGR